MEKKGKLGIIRSEIYLYEKPDSQSAILDILCSNLWVNILEEVNEWFYIRPIGSFAGFIPKEYVIVVEKLNNEGELVLPQVEFSEIERKFSFLPNELSPRELSQWLSSEGRPPWVIDDYWQSLSPQLQQGIIQSIKLFIKNNIDAWNKWIAELQKCHRLDEAKLAEWFTSLKGGENYFALENEKLYRSPKETDNNFIGWISQNNIVKWTGYIRKDEKSSNIRWYEVIANRLGTEVRGWIQNFLKFDKYVIPDELNDPSNEENFVNVFNLEENILLFPRDKEIEEAKKSGLTAAQYIDLKSLLGYSLRHYNLCGIFAVAAIVGTDVIPMLKKWINVYSRANKIVKNPQEGTSIRDLQSLLDIYNVPYENATFDKTENKLNLLSAGRLRERLHKGFVLIAGVSIKSNGILSGEGKIRHWIVVEDSIPVGVSGWVRVYNSFKNGDEVYTYKKFIEAIKGFGSASGLGIWVKHPRIPLEKKGYLITY